MYLYYFENLYPEDITIPDFILPWFGKSFQCTFFLFSIIRLHFNIKKIVKAVSALCVWEKKSMRKRKQKNIFHDAICCIHGHGHNNDTGQQTHCCDHWPRRLWTTASWLNLVNMKIHTRCDSKHEDMSLFCWNVLMLMVYFMYSMCLLTMLKSNTVFICDISFRHM